MLHFHSDQSERSTTPKVIFSKGILVLHPVRQNHALMTKNINSLLNYF